MSNFVKQEFQDLLASYNKEGKKVSLASLNANGINPRTIMKDFAKVNSYDIAKAVSFLVTDQDYCLFWNNYENVKSKVKNWAIYQPIGFTNTELIIMDLIVNYYQYLVENCNYRPNNDGGYNE